MAVIEQVNNRQRAAGKKTIDSSFLTSPPTWLKYYDKRSSEYCRRSNAPHKLLDELYGADIKHMTRVVQDGNFVIDAT